MLIAGGFTVNELKYIALAEFNFEDKVYKPDDVVPLYGIYIELHMNRQLVKVIKTKKKDKK